MDIAQELLKQSQNIDMSALASKFGLSEEQAGSAVSALLPHIMGGVQKTQESGGADLLGALAGAVTSPAEDSEGGNAVLGQIFGSKDVSRDVAAQAAEQTGIDASTLQGMLPSIASIVAQQFGQGAGSGGMLSDMLGSMLGGGSNAGGAASGGLGGMLGGLGNMLDKDGDGNPINDIIGMVSGKK